MMAKTKNIIRISSILGAGILSFALICLLSGCIQTSFLNKQVTYAGMTLSVPSSYEEEAYDYSDTLGSTIDYVSGEAKYTSTNQDNYAAVNIDYSDYNLTETIEEVVDYELVKLTDDEGKSNVIAEQAGEGTITGGYNYTAYRYSWNASTQNDGLVEKTILYIFTDTMHYEIEVWGTEVKTDELIPTISIDNSYITAAGEAATPAETDNSNTSTTESDEANEEVSDEMNIGTTEETTIVDETNEETAEPDNESEAITITTEAAN